MSTDNRLSASRALTFIEICLVVSLIGVIGLVIYGSFSSGVKVWKRSVKETPEIDASILLDKLSYDIRNAFKTGNILPYGASSELSLAVFQGRLGGSSGRWAGFGRVVYKFDPNSQEVTRSYQDFTSLVRSAQAESPRTLAQKIQSCSFKYYYFNPVINEWVWKDIMSSELPRAVKAELIYLSNNVAVSLIKIIPIYSDSGFI